MRLNSYKLNNSKDELLTLKQEFQCELKAGTSLRAKRMVSVKDFHWYESIRIPPLDMTAEFAVENVHFDVVCKYIKIIRLGGYA
jgi:hypothetical protein